MYHTIIILSENDNFKSTYYRKRDAKCLLSCVNNITGQKAPHAITHETIDISLEDTM